MSEARELVASRLADADALTDPQLRALAIERRRNPETSWVTAPSGRKYRISTSGGADDDAGRYDDDPNVWLRVNGRGKGPRRWDEYEGWIGRFSAPSMRVFDDVELSSSWGERTSGLFTVGFLAVAGGLWLVGLVYAVASLVNAAL